MKRPDNYSPTPTEIRPEDVASSLNALPPDTWFTALVTPCITTSAEALHFIDDFSQRGFFAVNLSSQPSTRLAAYQPIRAEYIMAQQSNEKWIKLNEAVNNQLDILIASFPQAENV